MKMGSSEVRSRRATPRETKRAGSSVETLRTKLAIAVAACFEAQRAMDRTTITTGKSWLDEGSMTTFLGKPCSAQDIAALEKSLGRPLPASYRAYLSLFGDKKDFDFPLGAAQHAEKFLRSELRELRGLFEEHGKGNPIDAGAIPFLIGVGTREIVLFVPPMRKDGEMDVVDYDIVEERRRFPNLVAYFEDLRRSYERIAEKARKERLRRGVKTTEDAIAVTIAAGRGEKASPAALKATLAILGGRLRGGRIPVDATITALADRAEGERFVAGLRKLRPPEELAISLATEAVAMFARDPRDDDGAKAATVLELLFSVAPTRGWSDAKKSEWLDLVLVAGRAATGAGEKELAKRLSSLAADHAPGGPAGLADAASITTHREAIDAVLDCDKKKKIPSATALRRIVGCLGGTWPPDTARMVERTIEQLANPAESARFVAALRKLPVPRSLLASLAFAAADRMQVKKVQAKAFPVAELLFDLAPKRPCRKGDANRDWLNALNNSIYWSLRAKQKDLALRLSELAMPHAGADTNLPHNAAEGLALGKRYDDALEMCRIAVKNRYPDLAKLKVEKALGPLRERADFKALFAKKR